VERISEVVKWLELIKKVYGDLPVLKEEKNGTYTDLTIVITKEGLRFKYRYPSASSTSGEKQTVMIGPIVEIF
jgi:hypothetical protein